MKNIYSTVIGKFNIVIQDIVNSKITILYLQIPKWFIYLISLIIVILFFNTFSYQIKTTLGLDKVYSKSNHKFKVLVLPFKQLGSVNINIGQSIKDKLDEIAINDNLNIDVNYLNCSISGNFTHDSATKLMEYHNVDFIVYGQYIDKDRTKLNQDEFCINYQINKNIIISKNKQSQQRFYNQFNNKEYSNNFQSGYIGDLRKGYFIGKIEYVVYFITAIYEQDNKNYEKAIERGFFILDKLKIETPEIWSIIASCNYLQNKYGHALYCWTKSINLDNLNSSHFLNRGNVYFKFKMYQLAIRDFTYAIQIDTNYLEAYCNRGLAYANNGQYYEAIKDFKNCMRLNKNSKIFEAKPYLSCALSLAMTGNFDEGLGCVDFVINQNDENKILAEDFKNSILELRQSVLNYDNLYNDALTKYPNNSAIYIKKAEQKSNAKLFYFALKDYNTAIKLKSDEPMYYVGRGLIYIQTGYYDLADYDFKKSMELLPTNDKRKIIVQNAMEAVDMKFNIDMKLIIKMKIIENSIPKIGYNDTIREF